MTHQERAPYLKKIGQTLRDNADELAALMTSETGICAKRFIVTDKVYDGFVDAFVAQMKDIVMGDPTDENCQLGPLIRICFLAGSRIPAMDVNTAVLG